MAACNQVMEENNKLNCDKKGKHLLDQKYVLHNL